MRASVDYLVNDCFWDARTARYFVTNGWPTDHYAKQFKDEEDKEGYCVMSVEKKPPEGFFPGWEKIGFPPPPLPLFEIEILK